MEPLAIISKVKITKRSANRYLEDYKELFVNEMDKLVNDEEYHGDVMILSYNEAKQFMTFIYWTELRDLRSMVNSNVFKLYANIAAYKDTDEKDYAVFSSSAPNFRTDPLLGAFSFEIGCMTEIKPNDVTDNIMDAFDEELNSSIFNVAQKYRDELNVTPNPYTVFLDANVIHPIIMYAYKCFKEIELK